MKLGERTQYGSGKNPFNLGVDPDLCFPQKSDMFRNKHLYLEVSINECVQFSERWLKLRLLGLDGGMSSTKGLTC